MTRKNLKMKLLNIRWETFKSGDFWKLMSFLPFATWFSDRLITNNFNFIKVLFSDIPTLVSNLFHGTNALAFFGFIAFNAYIAYGVVAKQYKHPWALEIARSRLKPVSNILNDEYNKLSNLIHARCSICYSKNGTSFSHLVDNLLDFLLSGGYAEEKPNYRVTLIKKVNNNILKVVAGSPSSQVNTNLQFVLNTGKEGLAGKFWRSDKTEWLINHSHKEWKDNFIDNPDETTKYSEIFMIKTLLGNEPAILCLDSFEKGGIDKVLIERLKIFKENWGDKYDIRSLLSRIYSNKRRD